MSRRERGDPVIELATSLRALSPRRQALVLEMWPGIEGETPDGLRFSARTKKELRRLRRTIDGEMLDWMRGFDPDEVFYDIGANVGAISLAAAALHGERIRIVAIEPSFASFESLARNFSVNDLLGLAIPLQVALLDRTGLEPMNYQGTTSAGGALHAVGQPVDHEGREFTPVAVQMVPTYTLDDLIEVLKLPAPTRVKIDIDGYEQPVLKGAVRTLEAGTVRELAVEVVDHDRAGTRLRSITGFLDRCGYDAVRTFEHAVDGYVSDHLFRRRQWASEMRVPDLVAIASAETGNARQPDALDRLPYGAAQRDARAVRKAQHATAKLEAKNASQADRIARLRTERDKLLSELAELRGSYQFSGAGKRLDLRELQGFSEIARAVMSEGRTGMNYDRLYVLWQAAQGAPPELPVVEVGAYQGGSAKFISEAFRHAGHSPRFYVCDTFVGHPRTDLAVDGEHHAMGKFGDTTVEGVAGYLGNGRNIELIVGDIVETSAKLAHEPLFGFVHIDVDVYAATHFCLSLFTPRLAPQAVIVVDDYGVVTCPGVQKAVDEFIAVSPGLRLFHLHSGQAILFRVS